MDPVNPDSELEEMEVEGEEGNTDGNTRQDLQDIIMSNGELEVCEDDEEKGQNDNYDDDDVSDEESDESTISDENKDEDYGYGPYGSP